ncbi:MAG: IPT/TIG domain-containing protein [Proteobacteria bacterium]|nr:IPT/TIG domain-containing protein [Pseudomonadota bacterium]
MISHRMRFFPRGVTRLLLGGAGCAVFFWAVFASDSAEARFRIEGSIGTRVRRRAPPAPPRSQPVVTNFGPTSGPPATVVTLNGARLDLVDRVLLGARPLALLRREPSQLVVRIPAGAVSDRLIVIARDNTQLVLDPPFVVQYPTPATPPAPVPTGTAPPAPVPTPAPPTATVITGFMPLHGGVRAVVSITGRGFAAGDRVWIGGRECRVFAQSGTQLLIEVPAQATSATFRLQRQNQLIAESSYGFTLDAAGPTITGFGPLQGPQGTVVRITGRDFLPTDQIFLGQTLQPARDRGADFIDVVVTPGVSAPFVLVGPGGRRAASALGFTLGTGPVVTGFSPPQGPPGTVVRITGQHFLPADQVFLGQTLQPARNRGADFIDVVVTPGVSAPFVLVGPGGRRAASSLGFTISLPQITSFSPTQGPQGTVVRVTGQSFLPNDQIFLGPTLQPAQTRGADFINVVITPGLSAPFVLVGPGGRRATSALGFTLLAPAQISGFSPLQGLPGTVVRITGHDFLPADQIFLGQTLQPARSRGADFIEVVITPGVSAPFVLVGPGDRRATSSLGFTLRSPAPVLSFSVSPASGAAGTEVTLTVSPARPNAAVYFGGLALPKQVQAGGSALVVSIPVGAQSGYFELEVDGQRVRGTQLFTVFR